MSINKKIVLQKVRAFGIHLLFSLAVIAVFLVVLKTFWYPDFLFEIDGGLQGLAIVLLVDVVLGPLLTLVIYEKGKKGMSFDLSVVVVLQLICLAWGFMQTYEQRPLLIVLEKSSFYTLNQSALDFHQIPKEELSKFPGEFPKVVYVEPIEITSKSPEEQLRDILNNGPLYSRYKHYKPFNKVNDYLLSYGAESAESAKFGSNVDQKKPWEKLPGNQLSVFFTMYGNYRSGIVEVDTKTGKFLSFKSL